MESYNDSASSPSEHNSKPSYESYKKVEVLGKGSFGKAFLVQCSSDQVRVFKWLCIELSCDKEDWHSKDEWWGEERDIQRGQDIGGA
jgi:hypothetical protein